MLATLLGSSLTFRELASGEVALTMYDPAVVRHTVEWMCAHSGAAKRSAAASLITSQRVVETARLSHYLGVQPLLSASLSALSSALDVHSAPSLLLLAQELGAASLEQQACTFICAQLDEVINSTDAWQQLTPVTRETLAALREATVRNPLLSQSGGSSTSYGDLEKARWEERWDVCGSGDPRELLGMAARVQALETYLQQQVSVFAALLDPSRRSTNGAAAAAAACALDLEDEIEDTARAEQQQQQTRPVAPSTVSPGQPFAPAYEWQYLGEASAALPAGLEVELPLDGRLRRARIPPRWPLRVWLNDEHGFWRVHDVTRHTTFGELRESLARFVGLPPSRVRMRYGSCPPGEPIEDGVTAEEASLWARQRELRICLRGRCTRSD